MHQWFGVINRGGFLILIVRMKIRHQVIDTGKPLSIPRFELGNGLARGGVGDSQPATRSISLRYDGFIQFDNDGVAFELSRACADRSQNGLLKRTMSFVCPSRMVGQITAAPGGSDKLDSRALAARLGFIARITQPSFVVQHDAACACRRWR